MSWFGFKKEWTKKEKIAVLKSICYIIGADEKIMGSEKALLAGYLKKYGLDESSMYEQASMSQTEMSLIISKLSTDDKNIILDYWKQAVACDGDINPKEVTVLVAMARECGINFTTLSFNPNS